MSKQLLRSGTAIGALIREAEFAQSRADFINKMSVSLKEANETHYWLSLLKESGYISSGVFDKLAGLALTLFRCWLLLLKHPNQEPDFLFSLFIFHLFHETKQ